MCQFYTGILVVLKRGGRPNAANWDNAYSMLVRLGPRF